MVLVLIIIACIAQCLYCDASAQSGVLLLAHREPAVTGNVPIGNFLVAKRRIKKGAVLGPEDVEISQSDAWKIPVGTYQKPSEVFGKMAKYDIQEGSMLDNIGLQPNPNRIFQMSLEPGLFAKLHAAAKKQNLSEAVMAQRLLEQQLNRISVGSKAPTR